MSKKFHPLLVLHFSVTIIDKVDKAGQKSVKIEVNDSDLCRSEDLIYVRTLYVYD